MALFIQQSIPHWEVSSEETTDLIAFGFGSLSKPIAAVHDIRWRQRRFNL